MKATLDTITKVPGRTKSSKPKSDDRKQIPPFEQHPHEPGQNYRAADLCSDKIGETALKGFLKTSAMAQSLVRPLVERACEAAPVPRPPQPTSAILMVLPSAA